MLPILEDRVFDVYVYTIFSLVGNKNLQLTSTIFWQLQMHGPHYCLQVVAMVDLCLMT
jgi:hypothetical protein